MAWKYFNFYFYSRFSLGITGVDAVLNFKASKVAGRFFAFFLCKISNVISNGLYDQLHYFDCYIFLILSSWKFCQLLEGQLHVSTKITSARMLHTNWIAIGLIAPSIILVIVKFELRAWEYRCLCLLTLYWCLQR